MGGPPFIRGRACLHSREAASPQLPRVRHCDPRGPHYSLGVRCVATCMHTRPLLKPATAMRKCAHASRMGISAPTYPSLMGVHSPCRSEGGPNVSFSSTCHIFMLKGASFSLPAATFILFGLVQAVDHAAVDGPAFAGRSVSATAAGQTMRFKRNSLLCCLLGCRHTRWQLVEGMPAMFPRNRNAHMRTHTHSKSHPHPYHCWTCTAHAIRSVVQTVCQQHYPHYHADSSSPFVTFGNQYIV